MTNKNKVMNTLLGYLIAFILTCIASSLFMVLATDAMPPSQAELACEIETPLCDEAGNLIKGK